MRHSGILTLWSTRWPQCQRRCQWGMGRHETGWQCDRYTLLPTFVNQPFPLQKFTKVDDLLTWTLVKRTLPALDGTKILTKVDSPHLQHMVWV